MCNSSLRKKIYNSFHHFITGFPWAIAFWVMSTKVDEDQCSGIPLSFVNVAKIVFTVTTGLSILMIPVQCNYKEDSEDGTRKKKLLKCTLVVFFAAIYSCWFAMWIYSWVAVGFRDDCIDNTMKLIWAAAIFPLALTGAVVTLIALSFIFLVLFAVKKKILICSLINGVFLGQFQVRRQKSQTARLWKPHKCIYIFLYNVISHEIHFYQYQNQCR